MNREIFVNKILPILIIVITTIVLTLLFFVFLFDYIETKKISILEKNGAVDVIKEGGYRGGHVFSEEALRRLQPDPDAVPYVFSEEALRRLQPDPDAVPYVFSEEALRRLQPPRN